MNRLSIEHIVPLGILQDDHLHRETNDNTCSRCRWHITHGEATLRVPTGEGGKDLLIYCETCLSMPPMADQLSTLEDLLRPG